METQTHFTEASPSSIHRFIRATFPALCGLILLAFPGKTMADPEVPTGVFSIANISKQPQQAVLDNPDVDGISLRQEWATLEPSEGNFDFSYLDSAVASSAAAGKKALIRIGTQKGKPAWVTRAIRRARGKFFTFTATDGEVVTIPVFWDPTFLEKKTNMIAALGKHFTGNPAVAVVVASFANATTEDWNVPHTESDVTNWLALGYSTDLMLATGKQIIDATMAAFPNQIVTLAVGGNGHGNGTNLDPTSDYLARTAVEQARAIWPDRLNVQKNDLSTFNPPAPGTDSLYEMIWDFQPDVGGQMVFQCINDPTYRVNNGVPIDPSLALKLSLQSAASYNEKFVEVYQIDVVGLPSVIAQAKRILRGPESVAPVPADL